MFSAATWLTHRIHFDRDYARTEGHPELVVHGPLQGAYLAGLLSDVAGQHGGQLAAPLVPASPVRVLRRAAHRSGHADLGDRAGRRVRGRAGGEHPQWRGRPGDVRAGTPPAARPPSADRPVRERRDRDVICSQGIGETCTRRSGRSMPDLARSRPGLAGRAAACPPPDWTPPSRSAACLFTEDLIAIALRLPYCPPGADGVPRGPISLPGSRHKPAHLGDGGGRKNGCRCGSLQWRGSLPLPVAVRTAARVGECARVARDAGGLWDTNPIHKPERWGLDLRVTHCASSTPVSISGLFPPTGALGQLAGSPMRDKYQEVTAVAKVSRRDRQ